MEKIIRLLCLLVALLSAVAVASPMPGNFEGRGFGGYGGFGSGSQGGGHGSYGGGSFGYGDTAFGGGHYGVAPDGGKNCHSQF